MTELDKKEEAMRAYWLGSLSDPQVEALETEWFSSDEDAELLGFARTDLIDDYLNKNLAAADRARFEKHFLLDNLEDVAIAKSLLKTSAREISIAEKTSFFESFFTKARAFFGVPQIAFALLLLISFAVVFNFYRADPSREIAQKTEPAVDDISPDLPGNTETNTENRAALENEKDVSNSKNEAKNNNVGINKNPPAAPRPATDKEPDEIKKSSNANKKTENRQIVFLTIFRGSAKTVNLSAGQSIILKLVMPGIDQAYESYELRIYDGGNNLVAKQILTKKLTSKKSGETFLAEPLKGEFFKPNNVYKTVLFGIDANGKATELSSYDNFKID